MRWEAVCLAASLCLLVTARPSSGQSWSRGLFDEPHYDFGTVARAARVEHVFTFRNRFNQDLHIRSVRSSCGCTSPSVPTQTVRPGEQGEVRARLNTRSYKGNARATITVAFDRPYYAEVQLTVRAYIRRDVVLDPGSVEFGAVTQGQAAVRTINLQYAGRSDWKIEEIITPESFIAAEAQETRRSVGRVGYHLRIRLAEDAPAGYLHTELQIRTNDVRLRTLPLVAYGRVTPALTVSPSLLLVGSLLPGQETQLRLVVRGPSPFRVAAVHCPDQRFSFEIADQPKKLHFIPVIFRAGNADHGPVSVDITVQSDLPGSPAATLHASGTVEHAGTNQHQ